MKSYLGCESLCNFCVLFESLMYSYEILSRMWVAVCLLGLYLNFWHAFIKSYSKEVSFYVFPGLYLNHWHIFIKFHLAGESLSAFGLHLNSWHFFMKSHPASQFLCAFWALFEFLICLYKILSSGWVSLWLLCLIWIGDMSLWNFI